MASARERKVCWFVGAPKDQIQRCIDEGIWESSYEGLYENKIHSMQPGDKIAIKGINNQRDSGLPFDNKGQKVSTMILLARGTILENNNDGRSVKVTWEHLDPPKEWYFYTSPKGVWEVEFDSTKHDGGSRWMVEGLLAFTFEDKPQDISRFRNDPFWRDRFGDRKTSDDPFAWTRFYEALADKLLDFSSNRSNLLNKIKDITKKDNTNFFPTLKKLHLLNDICPFSVIEIFNFATKYKYSFAAELSESLDILWALPVNFKTMPLFSHQYFLWNEPNRGGSETNALWIFFEHAIYFAKEKTENSINLFLKSFDYAKKTYGTNWGLTFSIFLARPWDFIPLDAKNRDYMTYYLNVPNSFPSNMKSFKPSLYLKLINSLEFHFKENDYPVHSFPELTLKARTYEKPGGVSEAETEEDPETEVGDEAETSLRDSEPELIPSPPYSIQSILDEKCFTERETLEKLLDRWRDKRNLILQGPPGTGKTWLAKRLAYALIGAKDESKIRAVQFHPNLSYEDFVRGYRPLGDGKLGLADGPLMQMIETAKRDEDSLYVMVIEEINRGSPAQIFGEMLTLVENTKRTPEEAIELCYSQYEGERVFVPKNLYIIGTMNTADRSIALIDMAFRRRFAIGDLEPAFNETWIKTLADDFKIDTTILRKIQDRLLKLNHSITNDKNLGPQFRIGHSYLTPSSEEIIEDSRDWFHSVVHTEIGPLLQEYWFDNPQKAQNAQEDLLRDL